MEDRYNHTLDGQEINEGDVNLIATEASLADDHAFIEFFRALQVQGGSPARGVLGGDPVSALVVPSGSANATINIGPLRAFIGPISPGSNQDAYKNGRSAVATLGTMQLPAITTNPRWDLIYVRVDVDIPGPTVARFVKTGTTPATQQTLSTTLQTVATLGRVQGTESATPAYPSLPADSGSSYYIPLAYVLLPAGFTLTTSVLKANINEQAPMLAISPATGAATLRPAKVNNTGATITAPTWSSSGRNHAYLPPSLVGKQERIIALEFGAARTIALSASSVLDDSIDWRNRIFKTTIFVGGIGIGGYTMSWMSGGAAFAPDGRFASGAGNPIVTMGQSFHQDSGATGGEVALLIPANISTIASGASVEIYVDLSTGKLMAKVGSTDPSCEIIIWLEATGQFNNAF